jgi:hypothetical protein
VTALIEGRKAAGISQQCITYALNLGTVHNEATIIRLAGQGHTKSRPSECLPMHDVFRARVFVASR